MDYQGQIFTGCVGVSMGAYNALQLSKMVPLRSLILMVPGVYATPAYPVKFGPDFSAIIRQDRSWDATDAWAIAAEFTGDLLVIAAENDTIIPADIPKNWSRRQRWPAKRHYSRSMGRVITRSGSS